MFNGQGASILCLTPNLFIGPHTIGKIVFIDNLALFCILCFLMGLRFVLNQGVHP